MRDRCVIFQETERSPRPLRTEDRRFRHLCAVSWPPVNAPSFYITAIVALLVVACSRPQPEAPPPENDEDDVATDGDVSETVQRAFQRDLREAQATLQANEHFHRAVVLDGSITRIERLPADGGVTIRATVSLSVRDAEGGQILVMLDGTAQATGPVPGAQAERDAFDHDVVSGAATGVLRQLEQQLRELRAQSDAGADRAAPGL